jgi:hypothetical protein
VKPVPREYAELRIDMSRGALAELHTLLFPYKDETDAEEMQNLRNVVRNLLDRFDESLTS